MMIAVVAMAAHWLFYSPSEVQIGIAIGQARDARLIALVPKGGCASGVHFYLGQYGDIEKAASLMERSRVCALVEKRAAERVAKIEALKRAAYNAAP